MFGNAIRQVMPSTPANNVFSDKSISKSALLLILGDWLVLALFVLVGEFNHGMAGIDQLPRLFRTTAELALPWTVLGFLLGAFRYSSDWRGYFGRFVVAWLAAAPLALLLRAWLHGQAAIIVIFMAITMAVGGGLLLAWRLVYFFLRRRKG